MRRHFREQWRMKYLAVAGEMDVSLFQARSPAERKHNPRRPQKAVSIPLLRIRGFIRNTHISVPSVEKRQSFSTFIAIQSVNGRRILANNNWIENLNAHDGGNDENSEAKYFAPQNSALANAERCVQAAVWTVKYERWTIGMKWKTAMNHKCLSNAAIAGSSATTT